MSAASRRGSYAEQRAADLLGGERVKHRGRYEPAPDIRPLRLPNGELLQPEVKSRNRCPALVEGALAQAARYTPSAIPCAIISSRGGRPVVCLRLDDFCKLVGLAELDSWKQLALGGSGPR